MAEPQREFYLNGVKTKPPFNIGDVVMMKCGGPAFVVTDMIVDAVGFSLTLQKWVEVQGYVGPFVLMSQRAEWYTHAAPQKFSTKPRRTGITPDEDRADASAEMEAI